MRTMLHGLRRSQDRRLHFRAMTDPRRRYVAAQLATTPVRCRIYTGRGIPETTRQACLARMVADLLIEHCQRLVLESRGPADDRKDARTLHAALTPAPSKSGLVYEHLRPYEDPLLWIPDAVSWCYGASGDWRRRISGIVERVIDLDAP